jgi:hypothetical protein
VVSRPHLRQPLRRSAVAPRGRVPPHDGPDGQGDRVHHRRQGDRPRQTVLHVLLPRSHPRAAPRGAGVDRQVPRSVRHGLRGVPRARLQPAEGARDLPGRRRADAAQPLRRGDEHGGQTLARARRRPPMGLAFRRREAALLPHGRGLRRLPLAHRPRDRAAARLPRRDGRSREHDRGLRLRQRRERRGRPERLGQREQVLQRHPGHDRGEPAVPRRPGLDQDLQPLPRRLGLGLQHPVQDVEALQLRRRRRGPVDRLLAEGDRGPRRATAPVPARDGCRPDDLRPPGSRAAGVGEGFRADPARGREFQEHLRERRRADAEGERVLLDARLTGRLAHGLEGGQRPPHDCRLGPLRPGPLGAVRHRERPDGEPRPGGRAAREAEGS